MLIDKFKSAKALDIEKELKLYIIKNYGKRNI